jgi:Retrotransposon gag protein/Zinc knuckle
MSAAPLNPSIANPNPEEGDVALADAPQDTPQENEESDDDEDDDAKLMRKINIIGQKVVAMEATLQEKDEFKSLKEEIVRLQASVTGRNKAPAIAAKVGKPPVFTGNKQELPSWLSHVRTNLRLYGIDNPEAQLLYAASFLGGDPKQWFDGILRNYFDNAGDERDPLTQEIFDNGLAKFEEEIKKMYGEPDEEKAAEDRLERLVQTTSASAYATLFRRDAFRVNWGDAGLKNKFYRGLKPKVKDELIKEDRHKMTLDEYINMAITIDNRIFERTMEDKGVYREPRFPKANTPKKYQHKSTQWGHHPGPMDIGAAQQGNQQRKYGDKPKDKSKVKCFNCDRLGHYARECRAQKKFKPVPEHKAVHFADTDHTVRMAWQVSDDEETWVPSDEGNNEEVYFSDDHDQRVERLPDDSEASSESGDNSLTEWEYAQCAGWLVSAEDRMECFTVTGKAVRFGEERDMAPSNERGHPEDISIASPASGYHLFIAWFDCIHDNCPFHYRNKVFHEFFPSRLNGEPIRKVHEAGSDDEWNFGSSTTSDNVLTVECMVPKECWDKDEPQYEDCQHAWCVRHRREKAREWHRQRTQEQDQQELQRIIDLTRRQSMGNGQRPYPGLSGLN